MRITQQGQGLIEALITLVIIAGGVIALLTFQQNLSYSNHVAEQQGEALNLAIKQIETLRDFSTLTGTNSYQSIASGSTTSTGTSATYTIAWTVTTNTNPNYKTIDVTVTWTDHRNQAQTIRLTSRVAGIDPSFSATIF